MIESVSTQGPFMLNMEGYTSKLFAKEKGGCTNAKT
jgi:hypothetical protein